MDNNRQIKFRLVLKGKIVGYEKLTETGWKWMWLEINPDSGERWTNGVVESENGIIRDRFTGLTDKEGKDIFERDVLEFQLIDGTKERGTVRFSSDGFWTSQDKDSDEELLSDELNFYKGKVKIVGTIHQ